MQNEVTITGTIKATTIKHYSSERGNLLVGWLNQRDVARTSDGTAVNKVYVVGMNIVALDDSVIADIAGAVRAGQEETLPITLSGRLVTKFDRRQNIDDSSRKAPYVQLEVHAVEVNA
jgi:hypothetical protein